MTVDVTVGGPPCPPRRLPGQEPGTCAVRQRGGGRQASVRQRAWARVRTGRPADARREHARAGARAGRAEDARPSGQRDGPVRSHRAGLLRWAWASSSLMTLGNKNNTRDSRPRKTVWKEHSAASQRIQEGSFLPGAPLKLEILSHCGISYFKNQIKSNNESRLWLTQPPNILSPRSTKTHIK